MSGRTLRLRLAVLICLASPCLVHAQQLENNLSAAPINSPSEPAASPLTPPAQTPAGLAPTPSAPVLAGSSLTNQQPGFDTSNSTKFYTITASLREEYDDNVFTTKSNKVGSAVTEFSPSVLFDVPMTDSELQARYTFGIDYYAERYGNSVDYTNEILLRYTHRFSNRFSLDLSDQGGYFTQPDLINSVGSPYQSGTYFTNTFTADFEAQWTPLLGTSTTYTNTTIDYTESSIGDTQNYDENTLSHDFLFAVLPKYNLTAGFIVDDLDYFAIDRGYTNSTLDVGLNWQALPNLTVAVRGGGSYTVSNEAGDSVSPYGSASVEWQLGKRSRLSFNYVHTVEPTDVYNAIGSEADRFNVYFSYDLTARINLHLATAITYSQYTQQVLQSGAGDFSEYNVGVDLGASYKFDKYFSLEAGYDLSDISSQDSYRDYTRNQVYIGVRGTY